MWQLSEEHRLALERQAEEHHRDHGCPGRCTAATRAHPRGLRSCVHPTTKVLLAGKAARPRCTGIKAARGTSGSSPSRRSASSPEPTPTRSPPRTCDWDPYSRCRPSCLLRPCPPSGDAALSISTDRYSSALTRVPSNASALGSSMAADSSACAPAAMCSFRRGDGTEGSSTEPTIAAAQATAYTPPPRIMAKAFSEVNDDKLDADSS